MGLVGLEQSALEASETPITESGGAQCGAVGAHSGDESTLNASPNDADLTRLIEAWPRLDAETREQIIGLIDAGG